ncbi:MAG: serine hydrolase domain-containing protein, partial [Verrucomicrobiota bacterium]
MGIVFEGSNHFARTVGVIEQGFQEGAHSSCQLSIIYQGERSAHLALGSLLSPGEEPTAEHSYLWMSSGKPMTAMAVALLVEAGKLDWDTRVAEVIPEFGNQGKEVVTLRHILSQSAALRQADRVEAPSREAILEMIYDLSLDEGQTPGQHAGYHAGGTWFVLGEVIKRVSG